ncbi:MAG TPA: ATPase domain-containing protein [Nitrososphaerales archaeon]|nr:ATPase domain-containing protein [Nitrososphaerales archaeon]
MRGENPNAVGGDQAAERAVSFQTIGTGSPDLDELLGGGLRSGEVLEVYGGSGSGKTQLAMQLSLCAAKAGRRSLFVDTEGGFRPERMEEMAVARGWGAERLLKLVEYIRCDSYAEQMEVVRRLGQGGFGLVVVDTLTRNFTLELPGRANMASRQGALGIHLSEVARDAYLHGRAYLLTNRVTFGVQDFVGIGGRTVDQLVSHVVKLTKDSSRVRGSLVGEGSSATMQMGKAGLV